MLIFYDDIMQENKIKTILSQIGLNNLEMECYLALIKKSPQRASDLTKALSTPKATVLAALYRLSDEFNIVKRSKKKNSYLFLVEDLQDLVRHLEHKQTEINQNKKAIESFLPELRSMQSYEVNKPKIYYYEGKEGMKRAFEQVLEEADEIIGYGSNEDDVKYLPKLYPDYYEQRVAKKIPVKAIVPASLFNTEEILKNEIKYLRKNHLIPEQFSYPIQVNIYRNTAVFYSFEENFALVIKSKPMAECLKKIFEFAFEYTRKFDQDIRSKKSFDQKQVI